MSRFERLRSDTMNRSRCLEPRRYTRSRRIWRAHVRERGNADISKIAHHTPRNRMCRRMKAYAAASNARLAELWPPEPEHGYAEFFKLYRQGRHAFFVLAGMHVAAQKRSAARPAPAEADG